MPAIRTLGLADKSPRYTGEPDRHCVHCFLGTPHTEKFHSFALIEWDDAENMQRIAQLKRDLAASLSIKL